MGVSLEPGQKLHVDTSPFIYYFEEHPDYIQGMVNLFAQAAEQGVQVVTSIVTYMEVLTSPEREGDTRPAARYREFFTNTEHLSVDPWSITVADEAVRLRTLHGFRTPDAVHLATARMCGADLVLTNDRKWKQVDNLAIVLVSELG
jgi:predicted nucleic acid-binding protein